jgi:ornithine cyclodeaminase/alanine dehydrogenase-like protein (mu-crystallin family)
MPPHQPITHESTLVKHFDAAELGRLFARIDLVDCMTSAFGNLDKAPLRQRLEATSGREFLVMPAVSERYAGAKLLTVVPANATAGRPVISGLFTLFDLVTGEPLATLDASELTARRTAAISALAASRLARDDAQSLTILGSGHLVPYMAEAFAAVRTLSSIKIWARNSGRRAEAAKGVRQRLNSVRVEEVSDLDAAIGGADILCSVTRATTPLIRGERIRPGTHVDLVGGYRPDMREIDDEGILSGRIFVDVLNAVLAEAGDLIQPINAGILRPESIAGDLASLSLNRGKRHSADEITLFKSVGTATADLAAAVAVWSLHKNIVGTAAKVGTPHAYI